MPITTARTRLKSSFCITPPECKSPLMLHLTCTGVRGPTCDGATRMPGQILRPADSVLILISRPFPQAL